MWHLKFNAGDIRTATRRADQLLDNLRDDEGNWAKPTVRVQDQDINLFIGADKSPRQIKQEIWGKRLLAAVRSVMPQRSFRLLREEGVIVSGAQRLVRLQVTPEAASDLSFNEAVATTMGFDCAQLRTLWQTTCREEEGGSTRWTS